MKVYLAIFFQPELFHIMPILPKLYHHHLRIYSVPITAINNVRALRTSQKRSSRDKLFQE